MRELKGKDDPKSKNKLEIVVNKNAEKAEHTFN